MSDSFHCKFCDKSIKIKSKKKNLNSQYHQALTMSKISRYFITNLNCLDVEDILKKHFSDYNKKFGLFSKICKFELKFNDITYNFKFIKV